MSIDTKTLHSDVCGATILVSGAAPNHMEESPRLMLRILDALDEIGRLRGALLLIHQEAGKAQLGGDFLTAIQCLGDIAADALETSEKGHVDD